MKDLITKNSDDLQQSLSFSGESMTVKQVAETLGVSVELVTKKIREIMPDKMKMGKTTHLDEKEVTAISLEIRKNPHLVKGKEKRGKTNIYFISSDNGLVKIGETLNVKKRFNMLQNISPISLRLRCVIKDVPVSFEKNLHERFKHLRTHGEWFRFTDEIKNYIEYREA